jgi:hypothetical protein
MVEHKDALAFAEKNGLKYAETSAKEGTGVNAAFELLLSDCVQASIESREKPVDPKKLSLESGGNEHSQPASNGPCSC